MNEGKAKGDRREGQKFLSAPFIPLFAKEFANCARQESA